MVSNMKEEEASLKNPEIRDEIYFLAFLSEKEGKKKAKKKRKRIKQDN